MRLYMCECMRDYVCVAVNGVIFIRLFVVFLSDHAFAVHFLDLLGVEVSSLRSLLSGLIFKGGLISAGERLEEGVADDFEDDA